MSYTVKHITLSGGYDVAYIDEGSRDTTLIFIHGMATYAQSWRYNIEYLKRFYRCIAIDLPGNGHSQRGNLPYSIRFFSGLVFDLVHKLGLPDVVLAGHSMGGQVAMHLVIKEPACARQLVLCAPAGFETFSPFERTMYHTAIQALDLFSSEEHSLRHMIHSGFYTSTPEAGQVADELAELMKHYPIKDYRKMIDGCIHGMLHEPVFDNLHSIQQPTLVLFGEQDALIPNRLLHPVSTRQVAETGTRQIPHAILRMVPQCGHFLQIEKAPLINSYIHDFVEGKLH